MPEFIDEDDLKTFEGWLRYQGLDATALAPEQLQTFRSLFDESRAAALASPKVGRMKFKANPNEFRYAVAIRKGDDLRVTTWVKRNAKGEFFVFQPRADGRWNPHESYHLDGTFHAKSHDRAMITKQLQPLTGKFRGTEHLGGRMGHDTGVGAIYHPDDFNGLVEVPPGRLGPRNGAVLVDLIEPGHTPLMHPAEILLEKVFKDFLPHVVIRIAAN